MSEGTPSLTIDTLQAAVNGKPGALAVLSQAHHSDLLAVATEVPLVLGRDAVAGVLDGMSAGSVSGTEAQAWASFVRHGYINPEPGGTRPLTIDYEPAAEDAIVEVMGRLDEIGDLVDGDVPDLAELATLRAALYS